MADKIKEALEGAAGELAALQAQREEQWQGMQQGIRDQSAVPQPGSVWTHRETGKDYLVIGAGADVKERVVKVLYLGFGSLDLCVRNAADWHDRFKIKTSGTVTGPPMANAYRKHALTAPNEEKPVEKPRPQKAWSDAIQYRLGGMTRDHFDQETQAIRTLWERYHMLLGAAHAWLERAAEAQDCLAAMDGLASDQGEVLRGKAFQTLSAMRSGMGEMLAGFRDKEGKR